MVWCDRRSLRHPRCRKRFLYAPPDALPTIRHRFIIACGMPAIRRCTAREEAPTVHAPKTLCTGNGLRRCVAYFYECPVIPG